MPFYELAMVIRPIPKQEVIQCLKRAANIIWNENGVIKRVEFLGLNKLPYAVPFPSEGTKYKEGNYFLYHVSLNTMRLRDINNEFKLELDILNHRFNPKDQWALPEGYECTLEEELLPPVHRPSVKPLLEDKNVRADVRR